MEIPPDGHYVSTGLMLFPQHVREIDHLLVDLRHKVPASLVVLTARDGQFISASGDHGQKVDVVALGSLIAGDLAASHQIAHLTGTYEERQVVLREGKNCHILVTDAGQHMILFVLAGGDVPVGWLRLLGLEVARLLGKTVEKTPEQVEQRPVELDEKSLADELDRALGNFWQD
jgi:predicted regulator of Ras-like GTPase activity (Roadblock/LC7/MglB family)